MKLKARLKLAERRRKRIVTMAKKGRSIAEIVEAVGVDQSWVHRVLKAEGVPVERPAKLADRDEVLRMIAKHGVVEAASKLGVSRQALYWRVTRWAKE